VEDLGPFEERPEEWEVFAPLVGSSMLELGNKRTKDKVYKEFFESRGFRHVSVDTNGLDGALNLDLTKPLNLGKFDMVSNIGTSEHVSEKSYAGQVQCWRNIVEAMHGSSVLVCGTPAPGSWRHHGVWYPEPLFYEELARLNKMRVEKLFVDDRLGKRLGWFDRDMVMARLARLEDVPFVMPDRGLYQNARRPGQNRRRC